MKPLSIDQIRRLLPDVEELRPLTDGLLGRSSPDAERRWAGSGELATVGERLVSLEELETMIPSILEGVHEHLSRLYGAVAEALRALAANDHESALPALLAAAAIERDAGRLLEAEAFLDAALALSARLRDGRAALPALLEGARVARAIGRWEDAEARYGKAASLAEDAEDWAAAATARVGAGNLAVDRGRWEVARRRYDEADRVVRMLPRGSPQEWHLALNRSIVAREEGRIADAEALLAHAEAALGESSRREGRAILSNARGQLLRVRGRDEEAEFAFRRALDAADSPDARVTIAVNLADTLVATGHVLEAGETAREAEELALRARVVPRLPEVYAALGRVAAARGHADAFVFFERALEVIRERRLPEIERARALDAYGVYDLERKEEESGRARLEEAARIYDELGCRTALEAVRARLDPRTDEGGPPGAPEPEDGTDDA
jgi:tetratricopeptide (TPR) repeat protein